MYKHIYLMYISILNCLCIYLYFDKTHKKTWQDATSLYAYPLDGSLTILTCNLVLRKTRKSLKYTVPNLNIGF